jgi:ribosome-associated toxin RatA of RatAB toxin-antitoxin module
MEPPHTVHSEVADTGLFSHLKNRWHFEPGQHPDTTWVTFEVDFAFKSPLYSHIASLFLEEVVRRMVGAFEGRCRELYGPSSLGRVVGGSGDAVRSSKH